MSATLVQLTDSRNLHGDNEEEAKEWGLFYVIPKDGGSPTSPLNTTTSPPHTQIPRIWVDQLLW